jgi:hypothetical protein
VRLGAFLFAPLLLVLTVGCGGAVDDVWLQDEVRERPEIPGVIRGVVPAPGTDVVRPDPAPPGEAEPLEPEALGRVDSTPVEGWTGPGSRPFRVTVRTRSDPAHLNARIGRRDFALAGRLQDRTLIQYPCTSCHEGAVLMEDRIPDAHRNFGRIHPRRTDGACSTCHVRDAVERLVLLGGETTTMDHAYKLCDQCHAPQVRDWAGGVHGKRVMGWSGERVVMNCADCHDPHSPGLEPRIPYPGPTLPGTGGRP